MVCDLYIFLFILLIISILFLISLEKKNVLGTTALGLGAVAIGDMLYNNTKTGGAACGNPILDQKSVDLSNYHIVVDSANVMHQMAAVLKKQIHCNADKLQLLYRFVKVLSARFPKAAGIHMVVKNQNIVEAYNQPTFEMSIYGEHYMNNTPMRESYAHNIAVQQMQDQYSYIPPSNSQLYYQKIFNDVLTQISQQEYNMALASYNQYYADDYARWRDSKLKYIAAKTDDHFLACKHTSEQLSKENYKNVTFHLAYEYEVAEKSNINHYLESRDDAISMLLTSGQINKVTELNNLEGNRCIITLDYFKDVDMKDMHDVPSFNYITLKDGQITYQKQNINCKNIKFLETANNINSVRYGYTILTKGEDTDAYKTPYAYTQDSEKKSQYAPQKCLYIGLDFSNKLIKPQNESQQVSSNVVHIEPRQTITDKLMAMAKKKDTT